MIKISVISYDNQMTQVPLSAVFGPAGGSLGRGSDNALILPDEKCHISRRQASIKSDGMRHSIMNLSQVSPIWINGRKVALAADADLQFGDEIRVGLYLLRAESPFGAAPAIDSVARAGAFVSPFSVELVASRSSGREPAGEVMPLDLSHLDAEDSAQYADILDGLAPAKIPISPARPETPAADAKAEGDVPELNSLFVVEPPNAQPAKPALNPSVKPTSAQVDALALTQAFLRGAKLPLDSMPAAITPQWMEAMGAFAAAVTTTMLAQLGESPLRKDQIDPDSTNVMGFNNPLRVLPSTRSVMLQMFGAAVPGFMTAAEAIDDAGNALRIHQVAVRAGVRASIEDLLSRLDPAQLEEQIKARPVIDVMIVANRKAKCWSLYGELFKDVCDEARDDDKLLFGEKFQRAYEAEWKRQTDGSKPKKKSA